MPSFFKCPNCEGYGAIVIGRGYFADGSENNEERECEECGGSGQVIEEGATLTLDEALELDAEKLATESMQMQPGWQTRLPPPNGDNRKLVTLEQDDMIWVGIRVWHSLGCYWSNNGEREAARVIAWMPLPDPAALSSTATKNGEDNGNS
jgi:hypothetical protein